MKRWVIFTFGIIGILVLFLCAQPSPPPVPSTPMEQQFSIILSNTVRSCVEEYTRQYVRAYCKAFVAEVSNQWAGTKSLAVLQNYPLTNMVPAAPQPCDHIWLPVLKYAQEHFCSRCGNKEWKELK